VQLRIEMLLKLERRSPLSLVKVDRLYSCTDRSTSKARLRWKHARSGHVPWGRTSQSAR